MYQSDREYDHAPLPEKEMSQQALWHFPYCPADDLPHRDFCQVVYSDWGWLRKAGLLLHMWIMPFGG
jgi:hypothetical protein